MIKYLDPMMTREDLFRCLDLLEDALIGPGSTIAEWREADPDATYAAEAAEAAAEAADGLGHVFRAARGRIQTDHDAQMFLTGYNLRDALRWAELPDDIDIHRSELSRLRGSQKAWHTSVIEWIAATCESAEDAKSTLRNTPVKDGIEIRADVTQESIAGVEFTHIETRRAKFISWASLPVALSRARSRLKKSQLTNPIR